MSVLDLAEKYLVSLRDKEIMQRYYSVKAKLMQDQTNLSKSIDNAQKSYTRSRISKENAIDANDTSKSLNADENSEFETIYLKLHEFQKRVITGQLLPISTDPIQELETLQHVVQAKMQSLVLIRNKIRDENIRLTNDFKELTNQYNSKLDAVKENGNVEFQKIVQEETELNDRYSLVESQLEDLREEYDSIKNENDEKLQQLTEASIKDTQSDNQIKKLAEVIKTKRSEIESMKANIEKMKTEIQENSLNLTKKKFGTDDERLLDEVVQLHEQIDLIKSQNAQIELKLKKYPILIPETTSAMDIDEDEMARQILFNYGSDLPRIDRSFN